MLTMPSLEKYKESVEMFELRQKILRNFANEEFIRNSSWRYSGQGE
jgi:hypothetical protein